MKWDERGPGNYADLQTAEVLSNFRYSYWFFTVRVLNLFLFNMSRYVQKATNCRNRK